MLWLQWLGIFVPVQAGWADCTWFIIKTTFWPSFRELCSQPWLVAVSQWCVELLPHHHLLSERLQDVWSPPPKTKLQVASYTEMSVEVIAINLHTGSQGKKCVEIKTKVSSTVGFTSSTSELLLLSIVRNTCFHNVSSLFEDELLTEINYA